MDLYVFDQECQRLIKFCIKHTKIYEFSSDIVALAIIWIVILTNYNGSDDEDFINTAKACLRNKTQEFVTCWEWIFPIYRNEDWPPIRPIEESKKSEWVELLFNEQIEDPEIIEWILDSPISEVSTQVSNIITKEKQLTSSSNVIFSKHSLSNQAGYKFSKSAFGSQTIEGYARAFTLRRKYIEVS
jgi:hypothetical protein